MLPFSKIVVVFSLINFNKVIFLEFKIIKEYLPYLVCLLPLSKVVVFSLINFNKVIFLEFEIIKKYFRVDFTRVQYSIFK